MKMKYIIRTLVIALAILSNIQVSNAGGEIIFVDIKADGHGGGNIQDPYASTWEGIRVVGGVVGTFWMATGIDAISKKLGPPVINNSMPAATVKVVKVGEYTWK
jgi:hypothetical protein